MVGNTKDPADGKAVAGSVFAAVIVYVVRYPHPSLFLSFVLLSKELYSKLRKKARSDHCDPQVFLVFCGLQAYLHVRQSRRGAIALN